MYMHTYLHIHRYIHIYIYVVYIHISLHNSRGSLFLFGGGVCDGAAVKLTASPADLDLCRTLECPTIGGPDIDGHPQKGHPT